MPRDAWERRLIEILVRWRTEIPRDPRERTPEEEDFMATTNTAFEELRAAWISRGIEMGLHEGIEKGIEKGIAPLARLFSRKLGRPLDSLGADRLGDVALDLDGPSLATWLADPNAR